MSRPFLILASLLCCSLIPNWSIAKTGDPVAVFINPDGSAVETMNGFRISVDSEKDSQITIAELSDPLSTDYKDAHELKFQPDENLWWVKREANELESTCVAKPVDAAVPKDEAADTIVVRQQKLDEDDALITWINSDGVVVLDFGKTPIADVVNAITSKCDVVIATRCPDVNSKSLKQLSLQLKPQFVLIADDNDAVKDDEATEIADRNVIAVSQQEKKPKTKWIKISDQPWQIKNVKLQKLLERKEAACADSRGVFAKLSTEQMNFVPGDGSHTPRWNSEHMMGRELLFTSQIYHALDPAIPVTNLNPKQMPPDYKAAHPDWSGREEALLTLRVEAFTRRFVWLLADVPLNKKAAGSRMWSPQGLLQQMERHYTEHTENVKKKMELDNWPAK